MQTSLEVARIHRALTTDKTALKLSDFEVEFERKQARKEAPTVSLEEQAQRMKAIWKARLGIKD